MLRKAGILSLVEALGRSGRSSEQALNYHDFTVVPLVELAEAIAKNRRLLSWRRTELALNGDHDRNRHRAHLLVWKRVLNLLPDQLRDTTGCFSSYALSRSGLSVTYTVSLPFIFSQIGTELFLSCLAQPHRNQLYLPFGTCSLPPPPPPPAPTPARLLLLLASPSCPLPLLIQ